jgi:glycosyltransferase involved in cell wall biosynthesis
MEAIIPTHHSKAIQRIGDALVQYAPKEIAIGPRTNSLGPAKQYMAHEKQGEFFVLFCNGSHDRYERLADRLRARGQKFAVMQIALRTTQKPNTEQWRSLWSKAELVWTYYPLKEWIAEDGGAPIDFNFYHTPLGVDNTIFTPDPPEERIYTICASGQMRHHEGTAECDESVARMGGKLLNLSMPMADMVSDVTFRTGVTDEALAKLYRQSQFVSGLRYYEGFELPAAEGLLCGARPVLYDKLHYRQWYEPWGEFVPQDRLRPVMKHLVPLFEAGPRPVTAEEREAAAKLFNWETIVKGFWERIV